MYLREITMILNLITIGTITSHPELINNLYSKSIFPDKRLINISIDKFMASPDICSGNTFSGLINALNIITIHLTIYFQTYLVFNFHEAIARYSGLPLSPNFCKELLE